MIKIRRPYTMDPEDLRGVLNDLGERLGDEIDLECCWQSDACLDFSRSGAQGQINIADEELAVDVHLNFLLSPFKARIQSTIEEFLNENVY
jgi:putative polyhydroxyalkanoate system protein